MSELDWSTRLRSDDPDRRGEAFETLVLGALELSEVDLDELAAAYAFLSEALLARAPTTASGQIAAERARFSETHLLGVWGLVYGWRTFEVARRLLDEARPEPGRCVEIGSGWGPYGLQAALRGFEVELVELSGPALELGARIFRAVGVPAPKRIRRGPSREDVRDASLVALPFSLWELQPAEDPSRAAAWLEGLLDHALPSTQLHVVEAGSKPAARALQATRDLLAPKGLIAGPCRGAPACPKLRRDDWCHFTWPSRPGPLTRRIADRAGRRWQQIHASWLLIGRGLEPRGQYRVMDSRLRGKAKVAMEACGPEGLVQLTGLRRNRDVIDAIEGLEAAARIDLDPDLLVKKGDGYRVMSPEAIRPYSD